ncbi:P-loop containing nucleoside triphosphate hydrolase protein [Lactarius pseudohatsudake]|nr:P-loop containing nucleoside triphosphate hydrolase protein [Lactarius pseudohatsudake]
MRDAVKNRFGFFPCTWQLEAALTQLKQIDLVTLAPMGSGKTLTFWMPLLFNGNGITIVITPLIVLGDKYVTKLSAVSIPAINLASELDDTYEDIESLKYRIIITSPEHVLNDRRFLALWKLKKFVNRLRNIIFDEAHCISQWSGDFCPDYAELGRLRWLLPGHVSFYAASATLPSHVLGHIKSILQMRSERTREIRLSNDRPNIHLLTLEMLDPINSCHDILRVLRFNGNPPPPPFMVFCNDQKETERLCLFARSHAPSEFKLHLHGIWGIFCTDAAGMGLDLRDIELVVQWKHTKSFCMLWQRLGRAARDPSTEATGIYIVEPKYMDHRTQAKQKVATQAEKSQQGHLHGVPDTVDVTSHGGVQVQGGSVAVGYQMSSLVIVHVRACNLLQGLRFDLRPASPSMACSNCPRCVVKASHLCCDVCNPGSFILPLPKTSAPKQSRAPNKFKADRYKSTDADTRLKTALQDWRRNQLLSTVGDDDMFGPQLIMTDNVLDRLVVLAHFQQVPDLASIHAQVSWRYTDRWGAEILDIIEKHFPLINAGSSRPALKPVENMPGPSTVQGSSAVQSTPCSNGPKLPRVRQCSACGSNTHIGMSLYCNSHVDVVHGNSHSF